MRKTAYIILIAAFLVSPVSSELNATISDKCGAGFEPLISISDPDSDTGHPGPPSMYEKKVCVEGLSEASVSNSCDYNAGFYLSSNDSKAHFSSLDAYNIPVCTNQMVTRVRSSCTENETSLFSVSSDHNAHVASSGTFDNEVCGYKRPPSNVTLKANFNLSGSDEVYFDGEKVGAGRFNLAEYPYIASESDSYTSGIVTPNFLQASREINQKNTLSITREASSASFFLPFMQGSTSSIEDRKQLILDKKFMREYKPSFSHYIPSEANVKVILKPEANISSSISLGRGTNELIVRKTGYSSVEVYEK